MQHDHQIVERLADGSIDYAFYKRRIAKLRRDDLNEMPERLAGLGARSLGMATFLIGRLTARFMQLWAFRASEPSPQSRTYRD